MVTRGESIKKSLDPNSAAISRDALAKIVYSRLFDWIVSKINKTIGQDPKSKCLIGVLDIYGFESFKANRIVSKINKTISQDPKLKFLIGVLDIYGFESFKANRCLTGTVMICRQDSLRSIDEFFFEMEIPRNS